MRAMLALLSSSVSERVLRSPESEPRFRRADESDAHTFVPLIRLHVLTLDEPLDRSHSLGVRLEERSGEITINLARMLAWL